MRDPGEDRTCSTRREHGGGVGGCGRCVLWALLSNGNEDCHGGARGRWDSAQDLLRVGVYIARSRD